jgi:mevalonate pyrophosphate decarboxylase
MSNKEITLFIICFILSSVGIFLSIQYYWGIYKDIERHKKWFDEYMKNQKEKEKNFLDEYKKIYNKTEEKNIKIQKNN